MIDPKLLRSDPEAVARNLARRGFTLDVEALKALEEKRKPYQIEADGRVVRAAHDLPGDAIVVDVAPPRERLVGDAQAALCCTLAKLVQVGGGPVDAAKRRRRDVGANEQQIAAEFGTVEATVKEQRGRVMQKMKASSVAELVRLAARLGI